MKLTNDLSILAIQELLKECNSSEYLLVASSYQSNNVFRTETSIIKLTHLVFESNNRYSGFKANYDYLSTVVFQETDTNKTVSVNVISDSDECFYIDEGYDIQMLSKEQYERLKTEFEKSNNNLKTILPAIW